VAFLITNFAKSAPTTIYEVTGIGPTLDGSKGEDDPYYTDGENKIFVLVQGCNQRSQTVAEFDNPPLAEMKNRAWGAVAKLLLPEGCPQLRKAIEE
jgi:hypothetical protein